jgi:hypothetical protein
MRNQKYSSHEREFFYKFMTADTAKKVLDSSSFKWSEPRIFNDPFDHQVHFVLPDAFEDAYKAILNFIVKAIKSEDNFVTKESLFYELICTYRARRENGGNFNDLYLAIVEYLRVIDRDKFMRELSLVHDRFNENIIFRLNEALVLCVSEINDNVVMWSHYADSHKGVCLKLKCMVELDNVLLVAEPIEYSNIFPDFMDNFLNGAPSLDVTNQIGLMKQKDWSYEKEWRVRRMHMGNEIYKDGYEFFKEDTRVFGGLYLGCKIDKKDEDELLALSKMRYPDMEIYKSKQSKKAFELDFEKIS